MSGSSLRSMAMIVGCGMSMSKRFKAEGDDKKWKRHLVMLCVTSSIRVFGCGGHRDGFCGEKGRALGLVYNESHEKSILFLDFYLVCLCGGVCMYVSASGCPFCVGCLQWVTVHFCKCMGAWTCPGALGGVRECEKRQGEWALVRRDEWSSGWGWYSSANSYDSPLPQKQHIHTHTEARSYANVLTGTCM